MPRYDWLGVFLTVGDPERREKDRERKRKAGGKRGEKCPPELATYHKIDKNRHSVWSYGGYDLECYRLADLASIYGFIPYDHASLVSRRHVARPIL